MKSIYIRCDTVKQVNNITSDETALFIANRRESPYYLNLTNFQIKIRRPDNAKVYHYWKAQELFPELFI